MPVLGLNNTADNPRRLRACDIVSLNSDGSRMTVDLHVGNDTDGDIGGSRLADTVVETATGKVLPLPVHGAVRQVLYLRDGTLLVRSGPETFGRLSRRCLSRCRGGSLRGCSSIP